MNLSCLRPGNAEMRRLAMAETDPREYRRFAPIANGPAVAILLLLAVGLCAVVVTPIRLLAAAFRGRP